MASGPEALFKRGVNQCLPKAIHTQSFGSLYGNGTPDYYYEGRRAALWAEYKWLNAKRTAKSYAELLEPLQKVWIRRARWNGVAAWVIVGSPAGVAINFNGDALDQTNPVEFLQLSRQDIATRIEAFCARKIKI